MNKLTTLLTVLLTTTSMASYASPNKELTIAKGDTCTSQSQSTNVSFLGGPGDRPILVCDERTIVKDVAYKECHYNLSYAAPDTTAPSTEVKVISGANTCINSYTIGSSNGRSPGGVYILQDYSTFYVQEEVVEQYNCRWEQQ